MKQNLKQTARERFAAMTLFLLICLPFSLVQAQTVKVNGRVTDDLNEPMIGVSIVEKGTANGCITDIDGNYTLNVKQGATLVYSYIGYVALERKAVAGVMNIILKEDAQALDEVVVVGYGPQEDSTPGAVGVKGENTDQAFTVVETMPKFPEGQAGLMRYLARSIKYPVIAQKNKEQGRVIIQMIIGTDGSLSNVKVLRSVSPSLDAEAVRVVGNMPKWEPGMQKGQPVSVKYTIPIVFRLQ